MNDTNEQISALVDGELRKGEMRALLERMSPGERERWERYHLISDVLRREVSPPLNHRLAARVSDRIAGEPSHRVTPIRTLRPSRGAWRQAAGFAVAASVTAIAIFSVQSINDTETGAAVSVQAGAETAPSGPAVASAGKLPDLDTYVVEHNEYAASSGMQGVLPYVRLVGHR